MLAQLASVYKFFSDSPVDALFKTPYCMRTGVRRKRFFINAPVPFHARIIPHTGISRARDPGRSNGLWFEWFELQPQEFLERLKCRFECCKCISKTYVCFRTLRRNRAGRTGWRHCGRGAAADRDCHSADYCGAINRITRNAVRHAALSVLRKFRRIGAGGNVRMTGGKRATIR